jgi:xylulokinase
VILTLDLGTSATKAVVWGPDGVVASGRSTLVTSYPGPGLVEQDPASWLASVVAACAGLPLGEVAAIGLAGARQTACLVDASLRPVTPGVVWSDRRQPSPWSALPGARWKLSPRDLVVARLTGTVVTDPTLWHTDEGLLPPMVEPGTVAGELRGGVLPGVPVGVPVVVGAGDRQCEVLGAGATQARPMVSWGTTANVSWPVAPGSVDRSGGSVAPGGSPGRWAPGHADDRPAAPPGLRVNRAAPSGWQAEGGLSAAGSLLAWLGRLVGVDAETLMHHAAAAPPGAGGVVALPWLGGARAPWWCPEAGAGFVGASPATSAGDLARAAVEAVAYDVARCVGSLEIEAVYLVGGGAAVDPWPSVLAGVLGVPGLIRRSTEAASVGAALLAAPAIGWAVGVDDLNPVVTTVSPEVAPAYASLRPVADAVAEAAIALARRSAAP